MKEIIIVVGHYGTGKTNFCVNLALKEADFGKKVSVCDLDIVNPYFRMADFTKTLGDRGIKVAAPEFANTSLDIPALNFDIEALVDFSDVLIIDVGGDDAGAIALGRYEDVFKSPNVLVKTLYVVNRYRFLSGDEDEDISLLPQIEYVSKLKVDAVVNNSNLGSETPPETVLDAVPWAKKIADHFALPLWATTYPAKFPKLSEQIENAFAVEVYVKSRFEF